MKKYLLIISLLLVASASNADLLDNASGKISKMAADLIPGEGVTEVSIDIENNSEPKFDILAVRDIDKTESTNFFTQISFTNTDVSDNERYIGNVGLGYRFLTEDKSMMIGFNSFYDHDITEGHKRASIGFEARASTLEFNLNQYHALTGMQKTINENSLSIVGTINEINFWTIISRKQRFFPIKFLSEWVLGGLKQLIFLISA